MTWQEKIKNIKCLRQERGSILVLTVILLPIMFAFLGFGYDFGNIYMHKARLQNVADAAALAGARAYLDSQREELEANRDSIDGTVDRVNGKLTSDSTAAYPEGRDTPDVYNVGDTTQTKNREYSKHPAADAAADNYIYKNIVNLGSTVYSDKWSHYAINSDNNANPKTFYRIGLYEEVPLYFLPIIKSIKSSQIVRAGAIALMEPGTTASAGSSSFSLFDNLFTFSDEYHSVTPANLNDVTYAMIGDMVYTHGNNTEHSVYYDFTGIQDEEGKHFYTHTGSYESGNQRNDPFIDITYNTLDYIDALTTDKLKQPHVNLINGNTDPDKIYASDINSEDSNIYMSELFGPNGERVWKGRTNGTPNIFQDNEYYAVDGNTGNYIFVDGKKVCYRRYGDQNNKLFLPCIKDGDKYYVLNKNNTKSDYYLSDFHGNQELHKGNSIYNIYRNGKYYNKDSNGNYYMYSNGGYYQVNEWGDPYNGQQIPYTPVDNSYQTDKENLKDSFQEEFYQDNSDKYKARILCNVFYITHTMDIIIDEEVVGVDSAVDKEHTPIYIIADGDNITLKLYVYESNKRPLIITYTGHSTELHIETISNGKTFSGVIYAPYSTGGVHMHNYGGTFLGNIIAYRINIQNSGHSTFQVKNYLENAYYTDSDVADVTDKIIKRRNNYSFDSLDADIKAEILSTLNIPDESKLGDMEWYNSLTYAAKQVFYTNWKTLYNKYKNNSAVVNTLWPWNKHFEIGSVETLRLINFRTDYQDSSDASKVVDPFVFLSLGKEDAY